MLSPLTSARLLTVSHSIPIVKLRKCGIEDGTVRSTENQQTGRV